MDGGNLQRPSAHIKYEISILLYPLDYIHDIARREFARRERVPRTEGAEEGGNASYEARKREGGRGNVEDKELLVVGIAMTRIIINETKEKGN